MGDPPSFWIAMVPLLALTALLFTRSLASNYIFDEQEALLANPYVNGTKLTFGDALHTAREWDAEHLVRVCRSLQPGILLNDRIGQRAGPAFPSQQPDFAEPPKPLGDIATRDLGEARKAGRLWETCRTAQRRWRGHVRGAAWKPVDEWLEGLCDAAAGGGNFLLAVGPDEHGRPAPEFAERARLLGQWLDRHGEAVYGTTGGAVTEFATRGWQTTRGNQLYLILSAWDGQPTLRLPGLATTVRRAVLLTTGKELTVEHGDDAIYLHGLPARRPSELFAVIRLDCDTPPAARPASTDRF